MSAFKPPFEIWYAPAPLVVDSVAMELMATSTADGVAAAPRSTGFAAVAARGAASAMAARTGGGSVGMTSNVEAEYSHSNNLPRSNVQASNLKLQGNFKSQAPN